MLAPPRNRKAPPTAAMAPLFVPVTGILPLADVLTAVVGAGTAAVLVATLPPVGTPVAAVVAAVVGALPGDAEVGTVSDGDVEADAGGGADWDAQSRSRATYRPSFR
jgi:hypothetical protein